MWYHYKHMSYGQHVLRPWKLSCVTNKICKSTRVIGSHIMSLTTHDVLSKIRMLIVYNVDHTSYKWLIEHQSLVVLGEFPNLQLTSCHLNRWCSRWIVMLCTHTKRESEKGWHWPKVGVNTIHFAYGFSLGLYVSKLVFSLTTYKS